MDPLAEPLAENAEDDVPPPEPVGLAAGTMVGEYRIEHKLGEGGMATVYAAVHPLIGKRAAIKVMSPLLSADASAVARFVLEARAVNRIQHPNIVDVFNFGKLPDGRSYFVMEWLQGETLYERIWRQHGPLPLPEVIHILTGICDALDAAHDKGIIHRDLKPANVFLCSGEQKVKLLDFGVAKLAHQEMQPRWTSAGCVVGTPEYVSPEQARGKNVDGRTDLYALGVIAYEMVLGRLPFLSDNPADAIQMNLTAIPPRPSILWPKIPTALEQLLLGLLAKNAAVRPSLQSVRNTLAGLMPSLTPALDRVPVIEISATTLPAQQQPRSALLPLFAAAQTPEPLPLDQSVPVPVAPRHARTSLLALGALFVLLALVAWGPTRHQAKKAQSQPTGPTTASVAAPTPPMAVPTPAAPSPVNGAAPLASVPVAGGGGSSSTSEHRAPTTPARRTARKHYRDANYLMDPFGR